MQTTQFIWFDGKLVPWDQAQVHVLTHSLHYGSAIFEGIRAYACADGTSAVFRLGDHCRRMLNSAKILRMALPYSADELAAACLETLVANKLPAGYIRPLSFVGYGEMGVYPGNNPVQTIIAVWPWGAYLGAEALEKGISIKTSSFARSHVNTSMSKAKAAGNYINSILAKIEAKEDGYDEAVMLDTNGAGATSRPRRSLPSWAASRAIPSSRWPATSAMRWRSSSSPVTSCTPRTRRSSPARPPSLRPSARWITARSAPGMRDP